MLPAIFKRLKLSIRKEDMPTAGHTFFERMMQRVGLLAFTAIKAIPNKFIYE